MEVDGEGAPLRLLAILGGLHPLLPEGNELGPLAELADLPADFAEVEGGWGGHPTPHMLAGPCAAAAYRRSIRRRIACASSAACPPDRHACSCLAAHMALISALSHPPTPAQLHVLRSPTLDEVAAQARERRPTAVYVYGGSPGRSEDVERQAVAPLGLLLDEQGALRGSVRRRAVGLRACWPGQPPLLPLCGIVALNPPPATYHALEPPAPGPQARHSRTPWAHLPLRLRGWAWTCCSWTLRWALSAASSWAAHATIWLGRGGARGLLPSKLQPRRHAAEQAAQ